MSFVYSIIIGFISGFLAGKIMRGSGFGLLWNCLLGLLGGVVGGHVLGWLGISWGDTTIGTIATAVVGAVIVLWLASLFNKK